jgi:hypothetical protein
LKQKKKKKKNKEIKIKGHIRSISDACSIRDIYIFITLILRSVPASPASEASTLVLLLQMEQATASCGLSSVAGTRILAPHLPHFSRSVLYTN